MAENRYNWKRFWCPPEGNYSLDDGGYLVDPDHEFSKYFQRDVVSFDEVSSTPCLIMLGEPGIGKSFAIEFLYNELKPQIEQQGDKVLKFDLGAYNTDKHLYDDIFRNQIFKEWTKGVHSLHLFLDSLDESLIHIKTVEKFLGEKLKDYPANRLFFRVASRTANAPAYLQVKLEELFGKDKVKVYELLPLRRNDVIEAVKKNSVDDTKFINEVDRIGAVPFAIKPLTLKFLIYQFMRNGRLPHNQFDLFLEGCRQLCDETEYRKQSGAAGKYTANQRLAIASRIAATTIFCNKYSILRGSGNIDTQKEDINISLLSGGFEEEGSSKFAINDGTISETLNTGLFTSRGGAKMGWSHKAYAEFLAAQYLINKSNSLSIKNIISLITSPDGRVIPQLQEVASWLAMQLPEIFDYIIGEDPKVLLNGDISSKGDDLKERLTEKLLEFFKNGKLIDDRGFWSKNWKLNHKQLPDKLRPIILQKGDNSILRRVAIDIAETCECKSLLNELCDITLNADEPYYIRVNAASCIERIGDEVTIAKLKPLVFGETGNDPDDELKGIALSSLWPNHLTAAELFKALTPPRQSNLIGTYQMFVSDKLKQHLKPDDLLIALEWARKQPSKQYLEHPFSELADHIIKLSWNYIHIEEILDSFARAIYSRMKIYDDSISDIFNDDGKRKRLILKIIKLIQDPQKESWHLLYSSIVKNTDLHWLIENLHSEEDELSMKVWADLISRTFLFEPDQIDAVLIAAQKSEYLKELLKDFIEPVVLGTQKAIENQNRYRDHQDLMAMRHQRSLLDPSPEERLNTRLMQFESGNILSFWHLTMELTLRPDSTHYGDKYNPLLVNLPGWEKADKKTRQRIIEAAKIYVLEGDPKNNEWVGTNQFYFSALAGYKALLLLKKLDSDFFKKIDPSIWKKWAPIIISYPTSSGFEEDKFHKNLVTIAYQHAPEEIVNNLLTLIDKDNEQYDHIFITRKVENCWDERMKKALLEKVQDANLKPKCMGVILTDLLDHDVEDAKDYAESLIFDPAPSDTIEREKMLIAARLLMTKSRDSWQIIWPAIQKDTEFGKELIEIDFERDSYSGKTARNLNEDQLADLYVWLQKQYPYKEDPELDGWVGPRERVSDFKRGILTYLEKIGKPKACEAIRKIMRECPELDWLKWTLERAEETNRQVSWETPTPEQFFDLINSSDKRFIKRADDLMDIIIESLDRLEKGNLHSDLPAVEDLWNKDNPKDENLFSDYIARHLRVDLHERAIVVNREVQIHRVQRTDIHVDAVSFDPTTKEMLNKFTVIIEVKGCWHREIETAMENQLIKKYLKDNSCNHGLYLIGWFCCDRWKDCPKKRKAMQLGTLYQTREKFQEKAKDLAEKYHMDIRSAVIDASIHQKRKP